MGVRHWVRCRMRIHTQQQQWLVVVAIHCSRLKMALTRLYYYYVDKTLFVAMTPSLVSYGLSCRHIDTYILHVSLSYVRSVAGPYLLLYVA